MTRQNHILHNPASELELPRLGHRLPQHVLTAQEAEQVMRQPDIEEPVGLRDRAILEMLYSTGMRRMEVIGLKLYDLDLDARHGPDPPGQGQEGPHRAHRRAGRGLGAEVHPRGAARSWPSSRTTARCS